AGEWNLEQPEHHEVETEYHQHGDRGRVVSLVDFVEPGQVGGAGEREQRPDYECRPGRSLAQLLLPLWRTFVWLCGLSLSSTLDKTLVTTGPEHPRDDQRNRSQSDVDPGAERVLGCFVGA